MTSYTPKFWSNLIKKDISDTESETFDFLPQDSAKCAPQYEPNSFVTMATYWVPDFPIIKGFSGHLWHFISIFANGALSAWSSQHMDMFGRVCALI